MDDRRFTPHHARSFSCSTRYVLIAERSWLAAISQFKPGWRAAIYLVRYIDTGAVLVIGLCSKATGGSCIPSPCVVMVPAKEAAAKTRTVIPNCDKLYQQLMNLPATICHHSCCALEATLFMERAAHPSRKITPVDGLALVKANN